MGLLLGVDFDGTLVEEGVRPLRWRPGAREALLSLKAARHELGPGPAAQLEAEEFWRVGLVPRDVEDHWARFGEMQAFLVAEGCWDLFDAVWQSAGKPPCDAFIDDRLEPPDWVTVRRQFGVA